MLSNSHWNQLPHITFWLPSFSSWAYGQGMAFLSQAVLPDVQTAIALPLSALQQFVTSFQSQVSISSVLPATEILYVLFLIPWRQASRLHRGQRCLECTRLTLSDTDLKAPTRFLHPAEQQGNYPESWVPDWRQKTSAGSAATFTKGHPTSEDL